MHLVVRPAVIEDVSNLAMLNQVVQDLHVAAEPAHFQANVDRDEVKTFFGKLILAPNTFLLIAEIASRPVGYIWFELQDPPSTPFTTARRRVYIHHIVVSGDSRGLGVGSALLRASEGEARAQGMSQVVLDTWVFNESAQTFFRAAGFEPFNIVMRKELSESA